MVILGREYIFRVCDKKQVKNINATKRKIYIDFSICRRNLCQIEIEDSLEYLLIRKYVNQKA